jgi:phospho-2-dehydro-3-deoxyheptonate aldolase
MVDCSHANSSKQHERQLVVAKDIATQIASGSNRVFGVMVERHLKPGAQKFTPGKDKVEALEYGIPPTCGFAYSERLFSILMQKPIRETTAFPLMKREK